MEGALDGERVGCMRKGGRGDVCSLPELFSLCSMLISFHGDVV